MKQLMIIISIWFIPSRATSDPDINIALKSGVDTATLDHDNRTNRYGLSGGVAGYLQWSLVDRFSLAAQVEFLYVPRGAKVVFEGETQAESREHYIDLVTTIRPGIRIGVTSVYVLLGAGLNLLASANKENVTGSMQDITNDLHRIDVALVGGTGVALQLPGSQLGPLHLGTLFLELRHDVGLIDTDAMNGGFKNRTTSLMLGVSFVLGGSPSPSTRTVSH